MKLKTRLASDWYDVQASQTITAGGAVTVDFSAGQLQKLISTAKKSGFRIVVSAIQVQVGYAVTYAASGAGNGVQVAQAQRGCFFEASFSTPNYVNSYFKSNVSLTQMNSIGRRVNPIASVLDRSAYNKFRILPMRDTANGPSALEVPNSDVDKDGGITPQFYVGDNENIRATRTEAVGSSVFTDSFVHPLCHGSGNLNNDVLAIEQIADPTMPWKLTISERTINGLSLRTNMFNQTALAITVNVRVYCQFIETNATKHVGVLWTAEKFTFTPDFVAPAHRYSGMFLEPQYDATTLDGTTPTPYLPYNFYTFLTDPNAKIRVYEGSEQIFPLEQFDEPWRLINHNNRGAFSFNNPLLNWQPLGTTSTVLAGPGSALAGVFQVPYYSTDVRGAWGGVSHFPIFINIFTAKGFPPGIIYDPGCNACLKISTLGTLPAGSTNNAVMVYVNEIAGDTETAKAYANSGTRNGAVGNNWIPMVDNLDSPASAAATPVVPLMLSGA